MNYDLKSFYESEIRAVDSSVFSVFTFPLKYGDPVKALTQPYSIVLTKEMSEKFFGEENQELDRNIIIHMNINL